MASAYFLLKILKKKRNENAKKTKELYEASTSHKGNITKNKIKQCRICLQEGNIPIYGNDSLVACANYIQQLGDIEISNKDEFPKYLCPTCYDQLQNAILFRKKAKESDVILRQNLNLPIDSTFYDEPSISENSSVKTETTTNCELRYGPEAPIYSCKLCKLMFKDQTEFGQHKNSKQHRNARIQCPICSRLLTWPLYKKHLARHQSATHLVCEVCGKLYRKDNLARHLQLHNYELPHQCQLCPYRGRFVESLKMHMSTHTGDKPFSCNKCDLRFLTRSNLNRHLLTHKKERPFKCQQCDRCFYVKRDSEVHFRADHAGIKDFGCKCCDNKYRSKKALMRHELRVHKRDKLAKGRVPLYLQAEYKKDN